MEHNDKNEENDFKARSYQVELFECAKKKNSILVLGTGSGKTFISILLIKEYAHEIRGSFSSGAKRTVFVVNTVPLVYQQAEAIEKHTALTVGKYEGSMNVDFWSDEKWQSEIENHEVLVIISKILLDLILHSHLPLSMINLMILDECHHATGNHPMREVMREYDRFRSVNKIAPNILGLTACVIHKKVKPYQVENAMRELEVALNSSLETSNDQDKVKEFTTRPQEVMLEYDLPQHPSHYQEKIETELNAIIENINEKEDLEEKPKKALIKIIKNIEYIMLELGDWCVGRAIKYEIEDFQGKMENEDVPNKRGLLKEIKERLQTIYLMCHDEEKTMTPEEDTNPKIKRLLDILRACKNLQVTGLVFVERRSTAKILYDMLLMISEQGNGDLAWVKPRYVVGVSCRPGVDIHLAELELRKQKKALEEFRKGICNIIVTTSVLEEGVDVRKCNIVLRFDLPQNFRAYVQSRGRARAIPSKYIMMYPAGSLDKELNIIRINRIIEKVLQKLCHERELPSDDETREHFALDEIIEPYAPYGVNGPKVTMNSAVALVNRYCGKLPQDKFTLLVPDVEYQKIKDAIPEKVKAGIKLPINAPLKTVIYGDEMENKDLAKKSAAIALCRKLHIMGELDHRLLPTQKSSQDMLNELVDLQNEDIEKGTALPGTRKRKQVYKKEVCKAFYNKKNEGHYNVYYICITQTEGPTHGMILDSSKSKSKLCVGLLCKGELQHCPFPLFSSKWGEVSVSLEKIKVLTPSLDTLTMIYHFHKLVIQSLVSENSLENSVLEFNPVLTGHCVYIVPLTKAKEIDQETLSRVAKMASLWLGHQKDKFQVEYQFDESKFVDAIVMPSYRKQEIYYVTEIFKDMNPHSEFPESKNMYKTYEEYYFKVYSARISNKSQPLIEVKHIPKELNYLRRIPVTSPKNKKRDPPRFVPELTLVFGLPASLWWQIMCVPSVLHRLNFINLSSELASIISAIPSIQNVDIKAEMLISIDFEWSIIKVRDILSVSRSKAGKKNLSVALEDKSVDFLHPVCLMQALTMRSSNDEFDLERLEVLGDAFLKFAIGEYVFLNFMDEHEGNLSLKRSSLVCNKTLYGLAKKLNLPNYLYASKLDPKVNGFLPGFIANPLIGKMLHDLGLSGNLWHLVEVPNDLTQLDQIVKEIKESTTQACSSVKEKIQVPDKAFDPWTQHLVADKSVADSIEAMIGAYLLVGGSNAARRFLFWLGIKEINEYSINNLPPCPNSAIMSKEYWAESEIIQIYHSNCLDRLESKIGYSFNEKSFLVQAVTHPSAVQNKVTDCYQRLEFLGDAVLDYLITGLIYSRSEQYTPGQMTDIRSYLVKNETLAKVAVNVNFHKYLVHSNSKLQATIDRFLDLLHDDDQEDEELACEEDTEVAEDIEVPKALGDVVEAIIGAVYLDSQQSLQKTWNVIENIMSTVLSDSQSIPINCIRKLYEEVGSGDIEFEYEPPEDKEPARVTIYVNNFKPVHGLGKNLRVAKQAAAKLALQRYYNIDI